LTPIIGLHLLEQVYCFGCFLVLHSSPASHSVRYSAAAAAAVAAAAVKQAVVVSRSSADSDSRLSVLYCAPLTQLAQLRFEHRSQQLQNLRRLSQALEAATKDKARSEVVAAAGDSIAVAGCRGRDSYKASVAEACHMEAASGERHFVVERRAHYMALVARAVVHTAAGSLEPMAALVAQDMDCNHSALAVGIAAECLPDYTGHQAVNTAVCSQDAVRMEAPVGGTRRSSERTLERRGSR